VALHRDTCTETHGPDQVIPRHQGSNFSGRGRAAFAPILDGMADKRPNERVTPVCRWRTSAETLDLIEALERMEALLLRIESRMGLITGETTPIPDREPVGRGIP
jgi:hypothetical protein